MPASVKVEPLTARLSEPQLVDHFRALAEIIGDQELVVVLDNCEHVIGTAAQVAEGLLPSSQIASSQSAIDFSTFPWSR